MSEGLPPQFNDMLRSGFLTLVSKINPEGLPVGGVLAYVIGMFWPERDTSEDTWNSIRKYAEKLINQIVDEERTERLSKRLAGFKNLALQYSETSFDSPQKGQILTSLLSTLNLFEPDYWDERNPEKMFPLFSTFGTFWISALAEQAFMYKDIYHQDDPDAEKHLKLLRTNIKKYNDAAQVMFDKLYAWRFSLLQITEYQWREMEQSKSQWTFTDKYGKGFTKQSSVTGAWGSGHHNPSGLQFVQGAMADRVSHIQGDFVENLQSLLSIAQLWKYVDVANPRPLKAPTISDLGPWGAGGGAGFQDAPPTPTSRITRIRVRHGRGAVVNCLEIFYDGKSAGPHGNPNDGDLSDLELAQDEYVTEVSGRAGLFVDRIEFTTNKGHKVGGGSSTGGEAFSSNGHDSWQDVSLFSVSGASDDQRLTRVNLQWKHLTAMPSYVPTYKRNGKNIQPYSNISLKTEDDKVVSNLVGEFAATTGANQYFPKQGTTPIAWQFRVRNKDKSQAGTTLSNNQAVEIWTSETVERVKDYPYLSKYSSDYVYYYAFKDGERRQLWTIIKMIPSDGPLLFGEKIYLRNLEECTYLYARTDGYFGSRTEPYAWDVLPMA